MVQRKAYFFAIIEVEHDGQADPTELCNAVGTALAAAQVDMTIMGPNIVGAARAKLNGCLGLDYLTPEQVEEFVNGDG